MVGTLVRLKLRLFGRGVRGQTGKIVALVFGALYLFGIFVAVAIGLVALRGAGLGVRGALTTLGFSILTVMWPLITLVMAGSDQTLDPGRFALFPVRARQLLPGLLVVGLLSMGGIFTLGCALFQVVAWSAALLPALAGVVSLVLGSAICVLLSRCAASTFSSALSTRRYRDVAALVLALVGMCSGLAVNLVMRFVGQGVEALGRATTAATVASWTPFGWAWCLPWDVARGAWPVAAAHLGLALALAVVLWRVWERSLDAALVRPLETGAQGGHVKATSLADRLVPDGPAGAIAARSLRYWRRDPRHLVAAASVLVMPVLVLVPNLTSPGGSGMSGEGGLWIPVFCTLMMGCLVVAQEISYDGQALWMQLVAGTRGRDDRIGRLVASMWVLVPLTVVILVVFLVVTGAWSLAPALVGCTLGGLGCAGAVGTVVGAMWQVPQPPPGQGAFARSSGGGMAGLLMSLVGMVCSGIAALPLVVPTLLWGHHLAIGLAILVGGLAWGAFLLWLAIRWGGAILDRTWPEVLATIDPRRA